jgi:glycosyltransferase involved in cell wall biosynthesis
MQRPRETAHGATGEPRIRLLNVVTDFGCGGTERQVVTLSAALADRCEQHFACLRREGYFLPEVQGRGIPVDEYRFPTFYSLQCLRQQWRLAHYIARERVQVVHGYNFYANVFALPAARWAAAPVIFASIRDRGVYLSRKQKAVQRHFCRMADCVLVNAEAIKDWLVDQGFDPDGIVIIRNGVDLTRFPAVPPAGSLRREFGVPGDAPIIGVVGRVRSLKGIEDAIDAAAIASTRHPDLRLFVIGESLTTRDGVTMEDRAYVDGLRARARKAGLGDRAIFTGYRADVPALLGQLSVSVQPSLNEGLSNVVLESMAAGAPTVATRVGGTPEALVSGVTGLLVPPASPIALAEAIECLLDDRTLARGLGRAGRRRIEDHFALDRMHEATAQLYADLLDRRRFARRHDRPMRGPRDSPLERPAPPSEAGGAAWR